MSTSACPCGKRHSNRPQRLGVNVPVDPTPIPDPGPPPRDPFRDLIERQAARGPATLPVDLMPDVEWNVNDPAVMTPDQWGRANVGRLRERAPFSTDYRGVPWGDGEATDPEPAPRNDWPTPTERMLTGIPVAPSYAAVDRFVAEWMQLAGRDIERGGRVQHLGSCRLPATPQPLDHGPLRITLLRPERVESGMYVSFARQEGPRGAHRVVLLASGAAEHGSRPWWAEYVLRHRGPGRAFQENLIAGRPPAMEIRGGPGFRF